MDAPDFKHFQKHVTKLAEQMVKFESEYGSIACDDMYEYLTIACTKAMNEKIEDALKYTIVTFREISAKDETMKQILEFFEGKNVREKKLALHNFIKDNPVYRTTDPKILLQRLKLGKKYGEIFSQRELPQTPIKDAMDELKSKDEENELLD